MPVQADQKPVSKSIVKVIADQVINPYPRERPKGDLESARPIDSAHERVVVEPAADLSLSFLQEGLFLAELVRLSEEHQMLVSIQLPNLFVVTHTRGIEIRNSTEVRRAAIDAPAIIVAPMYVAAGAQRVSEQWNLVTEDFRRHSIYLI
jgi:hypothetical protein